MTDLCIIHLVFDRETASEQVLPQIAQLGEETGWTLREDSGTLVDLRLREVPGYRAPTHYLFRRDCPDRPAMWLYCPPTPSDPRLSAIGVEVPDETLAGIFSKEARKREESRSVVRSLVDFLEASVAFSMPAWCLGDAEFTFPKNRHGESAIPTREQVIGILRKRTKPWLLYLGPDLLRHLGEQAVMQSRPKERRAVAGGALLLFRENPFDYLS